MLSNCLLFENSVKLVTSNQNKLKEYQSFGLKNLKMDKGQDLPEIDSTDINVIIYKAKDAGKNKIVDDTSLNVRGANIGVNVRWLLANLHNLKDHIATWKVLLGFNNGQVIKVYQGVTQGIIKEPKKINYNSFGFDPFLVPTQNNPSRLSLEELDKLGKKDKYSARKKAIDNYLKDKSIKKVKISEIPEWTGKYQH